MRKRVAVIVLGDLGHSPRMQNHCLSLAGAGNDVDFVGYRGSTPHRSLLQSGKVSLHYLRQFPNVPTFVGLFLKLVWQCVTLFYCLATKISQPDIILLQNPPGLPTMLVCWLFVKTIGKPCKFVIDWHNYTYSIFGLRYGSQEHWFVRAVKFYEFYLGRQADGNLCVTESMRDDLAKHGILAQTHNDEANSNFKPINPEEKEKFLSEISVEIPEFRAILEKNEKNADRPTAILVSSTSWTPDEDFDLLLMALAAYEQSCSKMTTLPQLLVVVTGKGPLKESYVAKFKKYGFSNVTLVTPWLSAEDYPKMLASADIGISLHFSSSGLDLPMKVVDMQACGLPVLGIDFPCAKELIENAENGFLFSDYRKLHDLLILLLNDFPENNHVLQKMRKTCKNRLKQKPGWQDAWTDRVLPYLTSILALE